MRNGQAHRLQTYLTYCVQLKTRKASPARKSLGLRNPAAGRMRNPVFCWRNWETFSSCKQQQSQCKFWFNILEN